jgi:hypothetical protein
MTVVQLNNVSPPSQNRTAVLRTSSQHSRRYLDWVKLIVQRKGCEVLNGFEEILFNMFFMDQGNAQNVSLS